MPPLPVIRDHMGLYQFVHQDGYYSLAVMVGNVRHYARDYKKYGVTKSTIRSVVRHETWKHVGCRKDYRTLGRAN